MKKILIILAAVAAAPGLSVAQSTAPAGAPAQAGAGQPASPEQQVARRAQYLAKELALTADQQTRLQTILLAQRQEMAGFRDQAKGGGGRQGMGQQLKATQAKYDEQIRAVLSADQYAKFDQLKDEQRDKLRERRASGQPRRL